MAHALDTALRGRVFANRYRIEERIGDGATGVVYRAQHIKLARSFAIKVLHPELLKDHKVRRRFEREAEVAATLRHDNVIGVVDVGESPEGLRFLVMDFAEGEPLSALIAEGAMPGARMLRIVQQLCDGLQLAHDAGLIHRDFKPDNVIVQCTRDGIETPRIVDFGIALLRDDASEAVRERLTTAGIVLGTPHYMAPEHASGGKVDHRIDLFALGVICFEMLTGRLPFDGDGPEVARANMMFAMPRMTNLVPNGGVDPLLEAFTGKLMARSLDERFPSARHARAVLDLIERDRDAARMALGLARPAPVTPRPMLAMPIVRPRPSNTTQPDAATASASHGAAIIDVPPRRRLPIGYLLAPILTIAVVAMFLLAKHEEARLHAPIASAEPDAAEPPVVAMPSPPPPPPPDVTVEHVVEPPPKVVITKIAKQAPTTLAPVATPLPPTTFRAPELIPSAAELAQHYGVVGRKLSALDRALGQDATFDLWPRYRNIRIQAALVDPDDRRDVEQTLTMIELDIDAFAVPAEP